jgi:glutamine synthetase
MELRTECMAAIAATGGKIKYGHNEVGVFTEDGMLFEQNEIEFLPVPAEEAADQLVLAKWIIRGIAARKGMMVTFSPKITVGKAGSGLHIHTCMMRDGVNAMRSSRVRFPKRRCVPLRA